MSQSASGKSWGIWSSGKQQPGTASPLGQQEPWARSSASTPNTGLGLNHSNSIGPPGSNHGISSGPGNGNTSIQGLAITSGAMETFGGELLSKSPQNGRRASPELPRTSSPFLHMRESRQRQATAAQAAALGPARASPSEHFIASAGTPDSGNGGGSAAIGYDEPAPSQVASKQGHGRMKSVMQARMDDTESFLQGPARSTSTPPYAVPQSSSERFGSMPFFTPQVMQRGQFDSPAQKPWETELVGSMRSHTIQEAAPGKSSSRSASPYISQSANATPFMPQGQQQQHPGFSGSGAIHGEYDAYGRGYEDPYRMPQNNAYAMYGADPYSYAAYDTRSMPRGGGYRPDDFRGNPYGGSLGRAGQGRYQQSSRGNAQDFYGYAGNDGYYDPRAMGMSGPGPGPGPQGHAGSRHASTRREDPAAGMRSQVLEEFRNNKAKKVDLADILGHVVEFSGDQHGSRFIQQKLETATSDDKEALFQEIVPNCLQLMTDVFGNYVIQKFFEHGNQVQKTVLAKHMETHVLSLSLQMYGCRVVQKALEHVLAEQQASMVKELDGHVLKCVKDQNGNHVIQKALERVPADKIEFILTAFTGQAYILATHPYGCRVIQRVLEHCPAAQASILDELHRYTQNLVVDQYGNYVSQHLIERGSKQDKSRVIGVIKGQVLTLSKHKFASNVVEKCIMFGNAEERHMLIEEVLALNPDGSSNLSALMKDQYGNYVLQKMLEVSDGSQRYELANKIRPLLESLKKFSYGKHLSSIERLLERSSLNASVNVSPAHSVSGDKRAEART